MTKSRVFWLKSDGKTIEEICKHAWELSSHFWNTHHIVMVHPNGEFYTNRHSILAKQAKQLAKIILGEETKL